MMNKLLLYVFALFILSGMKTASAVGDLEWDTNYLGGGDYFDFSFKPLKIVDNPLICKEACNGDPKCQSYTYSWSWASAQKDGFGHCYLKSSVNPPSPTSPVSCCISGVINNHSSDISENLLWNTNLMGGDYKDFQLQYDNPLICKVACDGESQCLAFTYANGHCWLKSSIPASSSLVNAVSGIKLTSSNSTTQNVAAVCEDGNVSNGNGSVNQCPANCTTVGTSPCTIASTATSGSCSANTNVQVINGSTYIARGSCCLCSK